MSDASRFAMDEEEADFTFADALDELEEKDWDEGKHPRVPAGSPGGGQFGEGGGGGDGESGSSTGISATPISAASAASYSSATHSNHIGISSDFDLRPNQPMKSQSGIVTANVGYSKAINDIPVSINPTAKVVRDIVKENAGYGARVLQDRAGNIFVWNAETTFHEAMMDALAPVETMWASDLWVIDGNKIISDESSGTDKANEWLARGQENNKNADRTSVGFVSPNVKPDLDFKGAVAALKSPQQGSLLSASTAIDRGLGIKAKEANTIGAWQDGAENSVMMTAGSDWDHTVAATVMKGHLAVQKQVLVFQQDRKGQSVLASFRADGKLEDIHKALLEDGLAFHTLVPNGDGATVYVCDTDKSLAGAIEKASGRYDAKVNIQRGRAQFIGDTEEFAGKKAGTGSEREQRDRARSVYETFIRESKVSGSAAVWSDVRDRWGAASQEVTREFDEGKHPRDDHGRWSAGGGGDEGPAAKEPKEITQQEHTWLVSEHPPQPTIDKWTKELTARSEELAAQGKAGNDEDNQIGRMQTALNSFQQESDANLKANLASISVVYDIEDRHLRATAFTYRDPETNVATIQHFGALDHAAGVKALEIAVRQMEGSTARIEGKVFGDDKASQEMFEAAEFVEIEKGDTYTKFVLNNPGAELFSPEHETEMLVTSMATAQLLGYDPNMVVTNMGEMSFSVGSKGGFKAAGLAHLETGKIEIFPRQIPNADNAVSITAHEVAHQKFETVLNAVTAERDKVMADPETLAGMKADGTLKPPLDAKYPLYSRFAPFDNLTKEFIKDDGITNYSKDYWKAAEPDQFPQVTIKAAMHETIAEMARRQSETGKLGEASPLWRQFYRAVMDSYDEIKKKPA
jgi:hypothetical protein